MPGPEPTRIAVAGAGAFGRNHLRVWRELERAGWPVRLAAIVEPDAANASHIGASSIGVSYGVPVYASVEALLAAGSPPDAVSLAAPTSLHFELARDLLSADIDVLIEKPMTATLAQADELIALAESRGRILQPGHLERFNPAVRAVRPIAHEPLFFEVHRLSVFTPRSLDVDVVLDLMIHDLDVVLSFLGSPVSELRAVGLPILSPTVDIANVRIEFESGCVANFTASRVSTERVRKLRFFQPHQYVSIDYARQDALCIDVRGESDDGTASEIAAPAPVRFVPAEQRHPTPEFSMQKIDIPSGEPLRLELESFLRSVRSRSRPEVTAPEGRAALALALDIRTAIEAHGQGSRRLP